MGRTFKYLNNKWSVELTALSYAAPVESWAVQFKPVNDPLAKPVYGAIWNSDLTRLSDDEDTPEKKTQAVHALKRRGYQSQPLRRCRLPQRGNY
jgi:hypothetical protein